MVTQHDIRQEFRALGSSVDARILSKFFKTSPGQYGAGDVFLGIRVPVIRAFVKDYHAEMGLSGAVDVLRSKYHEERLLGVLLLVKYFEAGGDKVRRQVYDTYLANTKYINSWDLVDLSAPGIVGCWLMNRDRQALYKLVRSESLWERRISIVATLWFIRRDDFCDTLAIAEKLLGDRQDLIHKATGWMLREVGKRDRGLLEDFLQQHIKKMPRTMLRYSIECFPEDLRQTYLKK